MAREREDGRVSPEQPLLLAYVLLAHVVILVPVFWSIYTTRYSDIRIYYQYASRLLAGQVPYRDFAVEYPPGALMVFALPRLISNTLTQYNAAFRVEVVLFDALVVLALDAIARREGLSRLRVLGAYTAFVLTVGPIIGQDFDIFPAATVVFALYFAGREEWFGAAIMLGVGVMTKLYPALLVPVFAMPLIKRGSYGLVARSAAVACGIMVLIAAPLLVVAPRDMLEFMRYHSARGIHAESTYGSLLIAATKLHLARTVITYNFASWNMSGAAADVAKSLSTVLLLLAVLAVYVVMYRRAIARNAPAVTELAEWSALVLFAGLITSKVLSPQYLIWLMPLLPLVVNPAQRAAWILFGAAGVVTYYIFPLHYIALVLNQSTDVVLALLLRNALLVATTIVLYRGVRATADAPVAIP